MTRINMKLTLAPSGSCVKVSSKKDGGRVQFSFPHHETEAALNLVRTGVGKVLHCELTAGKQQIVFDAILAPIGAAIRFGGEVKEDDAGRINLELPQTEMSALLEIAAYAPGLVLILDIVPGETMDAT